MAIRRELAQALKKVDEAEQTQYAEFIKMQIIQTGIFAAALRVVEFFQAGTKGQTAQLRPADPSTNTAPLVQNVAPNPSSSDYSHGLSEAAYHAVANKKLRHGLEPLLSGPLMLLTLPTMSPAHLKAALTILSPSKEFPAPKRRTNPTFHEPAVQNGLQKLLLLGARAEGRIFDVEGAQWIGGIEGGLTGLRAQLVAILQGFGANLTNTLEAASKSLYFTMESRKSVLEEEEKPKEETS
jgi:large subunit ribosomal protein L10